MIPFSKQQTANRKQQIRTSISRCLLIAACCSLLSISNGQTPTRSQSLQRPVTWKIDNLKKIGGNQITVTGEPHLIKVPGGKAVIFDGVDDGLIVNSNPVAGAKAFTIEAVFRPDAGG